MVCRHVLCLLQVQLKLMEGPGVKPVCKGGSESATSQGAVPLCRLSGPARTGRVGAAVSVCKMKSRFGHHRQCQRATLLAQRQVGVATLLAQC